MNNRDEPQGKFLVACAQALGAFIFIIGAMQYWAIQNPVGSFYLMALGFGVAWFARQCFDFYNLRVIRLLVVRFQKKRKEKKRQIRQNKSQDQV